MARERTKKTARPSPAGRGEHGRDTKSWSLKATGSEVSEIIRTAFGRDAFEVKKRNGKLLFAVSSANARSGAVRSRLKNVGGAGIRNKSALDRLTAAGVVGCVRSGIPDLATNKDHMEGFGRG